MRIKVLESSDKAEFNRMIDVVKDDDGIIMLEPDSSHLAKTERLLPAKRVKKSNNNITQHSGAVSSRSKRFSSLAKAVPQAKFVKEQATAASPYKLKQYLSTKKQVDFNKR